MIEWFIIITTVLFISVFAYIKIKYPFWSTQSIYHSYDWVSQWFSNPFIMRIIKTKYYDPIQYQTKMYSDIDNSELEELCKLLQEHYTDEEQVLHKVEIDTINNIYNNPQSMITTYRLQDFCYKGHGELQINQYKNMLGMTGSYPVKLLIQTTNNTVFEKGWVLQHLCSNRYEGIKRKEIHQKLLDNHIYNIFQRSGEHTFHLMIKYGMTFSGVVPFVETKQNIYNIKNISNTTLKPGYSVISCKEENYRNVFEIIDTENTNICYRLSLERASLISQIENESIRIYILFYKTQIVAIYIVKPENMFYDDYDGYGMIITSSICLQNSVNDDIAFQEGFKYLVSELSRKQTSVLKINGLSDNVRLQSNAIDRLPIEQVPMSVYFHNYLIPSSPVTEKNVFSLFG